MENIKPLIHKLLINGAIMGFSILFTLSTAYSFTKYISEQDRLYIVRTASSLKDNHLTDTEPVVHITISQAIIHNVVPILQNVSYLLCVFLTYPLLYSKLCFSILRKIHLDIVHRNIYLILKCIVIQVYLIVMIKYIDNC